MTIVLKGVELGVVLALLIGPVFFTIIETSIERGFWRGVQVAAGVSLSDILYVAICYFGFAQVVANPGVKTYMAYAGGALLIGFGSYHLFVKGSKGLEAQPAVNEQHFTRFMAKGFLINGLTPMVLLFWIATVSLATLDFGYSRTPDFVIFFASLLITVFITDVLKAYLAGRLRRIMTPASLRVMNIVLGIVLIAFGVRLMLAAKMMGTA